MDILKNKNIEILNENNKVIILNKNNFNWLRISEVLYTKYLNEDDNSKKILLEAFRKYNILSDEVPDNKYMNIKSMYFAVTKKCNMSCEFCSMKSNPNINIDNDLTIDEIKNIIPKLREINPRKIILTGGEPTVRKDIIELVDLFSNSFGSNKIILQSNGLLLTPELVKELSGKILRVDISVESIFEDDKLYNFFINVFENLKKENIDSRLSFVISPENKKYFNDAIDIAVKYNAPMDIRLVSPIGYALEHDNIYFNEEQIIILYKELIELIIEKGYINKGIFDLSDFPLQPKLTCGAYGRTLSMYPDGNVYMCHSLQDSVFNLGNIKDISYEEISSNLNLKLDNKKIKDLLIVDNITPCKDCSVKYFCSGVCAANRLACNDKDRLTVGCAMIKLLIKFNLFYYNKKLSSLENLKELLNHINIYLEENYSKNKKAESSN